MNTENKRPTVVAGNWKMNLLPDQVQELMLNIIPSVRPQSMVIIAAPSIYLQSLHEDFGESVFLAAQNCSDKDSGAFTGEISAAMLQAIGIEFCLVGHSERRSLYNETDDVVRWKVDACLKNQVNPIFCCGETLDERKSAQHFHIVQQQIEAALFHLDLDQILKVVIAYEPVWAIGTGVTATSSEAQEMHAHVRRVIEEKFGPEVSESILILYGGSVNAGNCAELFAQTDVDGGLVGGASLKADEFKVIMSQATAIPS
ncbi:MAG: triose-phosphate isomerase [Flavobacteriales bacterium]